MKSKLLILPALILAIALCVGLKSNAKAMNTNGDTTSSATAPRGDVKVEMVTDMGTVTLLLYGDTPLHLDNFVKLVNEGFYNGLLFHRVINDFMVQAGDPDSKNAPQGKMLGAGDPGYTIEAEFAYPRHFHKRGALAAAREGDATNPGKRSSGSQFYIVTGRTYSPGQLEQMDKRMQLENQKKIFDKLTEQYRDSIMNMRRNRDQIGLAALQEKLVAESDSLAKQNPVGMPDDVKEVYSTIGGTPHLDGSYTVFGEVIDGMDVVDRIQKVETDSNDRPTEDVKIISMKVID